MDDVANDIDRLTAKGDPSELIRFVDRLVDNSGWDHLLTLRDACDAAAERGHQLWPVRTHIEYRLALQAPPAQAAAVITSGAGFAALGPLTEVVAQHHTFDELAPHLDDAPLRAVVAQERIVRGDDLSGRGDAELDRFELPGVMAGWERYPVAVYEPYDAAFAGPVFGPGRWHDLSGAADSLDDPETTEAATALVSTWLESGGGRLETVAVEGSITDAVAGLGLSRARIDDLAPGDAVSWLGWVGASAGANGRRRGSAAGRLNTWWLLAQMADCDVDEHDEVTNFVNRARWARFDVGEPEIGWQFRLAVDDPDSGLAWAFAAQDF